MEENVKILVCCHKADPNIKEDDLYMPIQVGKAISSYDLVYVGDNTGENISERNREYCELTALYWAWKNLSSVQYVGLAHYRRYFANKVTAQYVRNVLGKGGYDVIVCKKVVLPHTNYMDLCYYVGVENVYILLDSVLKFNPDYQKTLSSYYFHYNCSTPCNMFISSQSWMNGYCQWLFQILDNVEKRMRKSPYSRANRALGYMGESLLGLYLYHNRHFKIKRVRNISLLEEFNKKHLVARKIVSNIRNNLAFCIINSINGSFFKKLLGRPLGIKVIPAVRTGFAIDGIEIPYLDNLDKE